MIDSVPWLTDDSDLFLGWGIAALVIAVVALGVGVRFGLWIKRRDVRLRVLAFLGVLAVAGVVAAPIAFTHSSAVHAATAARQVKLIAEGWGIAPEDASALMRASESRRDRGQAWIKLDGKTQQAALQGQDGRVLLFRGEKVVPRPQ